MEPKWKQCERLLARMAKSMGCAIKAVPGNWLVRAHWYVALPAPGGDWPLTVEYYSPVELLDRVLRYYREFRPMHDRVVGNPFFGMSPEEVELRLAVMGA